MHISARSYLTSGIAALGAGAIALSPIQPLPEQPAPGREKAVAHLAVNLAATIDPITPWVNTFKTAAANIETLGKLNAQNPFPLAKTIGANLATYSKELANGQGNLIPEQIWGNVQTFFQAPWDPGTSVPIPYTDAQPLLAIGEYASDTQPADGTNNPNSIGLLPAQLIAGQLASGCEADNSCTLRPLIPIVNFLNNHYSGQLVALVGTLIAPFVQLTKSFTAIGEFFKAGDVTGAINELINIPANMTNAALNGVGVLDLTGVLKAVAPDIGGEIGLIGLNLGGLLNAMPQNGSLYDPKNPPTKWAGGIGLDSIVFGQEPPPANPFAGGIPNGLLGANIGLGQFLADKLLVKPPAPGQALAPASAVKAAAAVEAPAAAPAEAPAVVSAPVEAAAPVVAAAPAPVAEAPAPVAEAPAPVEAPAAPATPVSEPAPAAVAKLVAESEPAPVSAPAPSRARAAATAGNSAAGQDDSSDNAPAHRGSRGR